MKPLFTFVLVLMVATSFADPSWNQKDATPEANGSYSNWLPTTFELSDVNTVSEQTWGQPIIGFDANQSTFILTVDPDSLTKWAINPTTNQTYKVWTIGVGSQITGLPACDKSQIYLPIEGAVCGLSVDDGHQIWRTPIGGNPSSVRCDNGDELSWLSVTTDQGHVAVIRKTGTLFWEAADGLEAGDSLCTAVSRGILYDVVRGLPTSMIIYAHLEDGRILATLTEQNVSPIWGPMLGHGYVYVWTKTNTNSARLNCYNSSNLVRVWTRDYNNLTMWPTPPAIWCERLYFSAPKLVALNHANQQVIWEKPSVLATSNLATSADGKIVVGVKENNLNFLKAYAPDGSEAFSYLMMNGQVQGVALHNHEIWCLAGAQLWRFGESRNPGINETPQPSISPTMIWPNPCRDYLNITTNHKSPIRIYGIQGQKIGTIPSGQTHYKISDWAPGTYFLLLNQEQLRFVKQ